MPLRPTSSGRAFSFQRHGECWWHPSCCPEWAVMKRGLTPLADEAAASVPGKPKSCELDGSTEFAMSSAFQILSTLAAVAVDAAGPALPPFNPVTPAQQAIANYKAEWAHRGTPKPCPLARSGEIIVCGDGRGGSPDRLPLPEERGPPDWARRRIGEVPSASAGLVDVTPAQPDPGPPPTAIKGLVDAVSALVGKITTSH